MTVLFVAMTILLFLALDVIVRQSRARADVSTVDTRAVAWSYPVRLPEGLFFARTHTWMSLFPSGKMRLGVDDFVGRLLDSPSIAYLKTPHQRVQKGEPILVLTEGDHSLTIRAPMDGEILERNDRLCREPGMLKEMLFTDGWAYTIAPARHSDIKHLLLGEETRRWIAEEFCRLRDLFAQEGSANNTIPALLQDGGPPVGGALKCVQPRTWEQFDRMFLREAE
ncbi:MAG: hypothetical protein A2X66_08515 [Ignavibacteria bacterium GWA2_54_16]|nr:MAG: hypothetical protein A2X66_08515 [Ignavibacteria bacterium GWA2_54_16]